MTSYLSFSHFQDDCAGIFQFQSFIVKVTYLLYLLIITGGELQEFGDNRNEQQIVTVRGMRIEMR